MPGPYESRHQYSGFSVVGEWETTSGATIANYLAIDLHFQGYTRYSPVRQQIYFHGNGNEGMGISGDFHSWTFLDISIPFSPCHMHTRIKPRSNPDTSGLYKNPSSISIPETNRGPWKFPEISGNSRKFPLLSFSPGPCTRAPQVHPQL